MLTFASLESKPRESREAHKHYQELLQQTPLTTERQALMAVSLCSRAITVVNHICHFLFPRNTVQDEEMGLEKSVVSGE